MRELLAQTAPAAELLDAVAEAIPLADASVDAVSPRSRSTGSIPRPPRPRSRASCAPGRRRGPDLEPARRARRPGCASSRASSTRAPATRRATARATGAAASTPIRRSRRSSCETWPHRGAEGRDVVLARVASMSFVAALDEEPRARLLAEVADLLDTHPGHARPRRRRAALRDGALHHAQALASAGAAGLPVRSPARRAARGSSTGRGTA